MISVVKINEDTGRVRKIGEVEPNHDLDVYDYNQQYNSGGFGYHQGIERFKSGYVLINLSQHQGEGCYAEEISAEKAKMLIETRGDYDLKEKFSELF